MTTQLIDPQAVAKIEAAKDKLKSGSWGGIGTVCMMSAMVSGAQSTDDCVTDGWPKWLAELNVRLFDADVGAGDEDAARYQFALDVAHAVQEPRDYDKARDLFLIARLDTGEHSALKSLEKLDGDWTQQRDVVERVVTLLHRRIAGENVVQEMKNAAGAAAAAADAAGAAAADADAAADAAAYAAAADAAAASAATYAAYAATYAADAAATYAADAAARNDLIAALKGAREMSDDLVKQALEELQDLVRCRCHDAYKGRGLHDPTCCCDSAEAVKVVSDRIEELEAANNRLNEQMASIEEMGTESLNALPDCLMRLAPALVENGELKAKLEKAVEGFEELARLGNGDRYGNSFGNLIAQKYIAELTGGKDE